MYNARKAAAKLYENYKTCLYTFLNLTVRDSTILYRVIDNYESFDEVKETVSKIAFEID